MHSFTVLYFCKDKDRLCFQRNVLTTKCITEGHLTHNEGLYFKIALIQNNCCVLAKVFTIYSTTVTIVNSVSVPKSH